jgi:hypothetical protein
VHRVYGLKLALAGTVLSRRAAAEPSFGLSDAQREWARARARTMVDELGTLGIAIIGDLADLIPCEAGHAGFDPGRTNKTELLSAAVDALVGLTKHTARLRARCEALRSELTAVQLECDVLRSQLESSGTGSTGSSLAG